MTKILNKVLAFAYRIKMLYKKIDKIHKLNEYNNGMCEIKFYNRMKSAAKRQLTHQKM